jgi:hypothetical protein
MNSKESYNKVRFELARVFSFNIRVINLRGSFKISYLKCSGILLELVNLPKILRLLHYHTWMGGHYNNDEKMKNCTVIEILFRYLP